MADKRNSIRMRTIDKLVGVVEAFDEHTGMVGFNDNNEGPGFGKKNESQNPTPPRKAFFLSGINKKLID